MSAKAACDFHLGETHQRKVDFKDIIKEVVTFWVWQTLNRSANVIQKELPRLHRQLQRKLTHDADETFTKQMDALRLWITNGEFGKLRRVQATAMEERLHGKDVESLRRLGANSKESPNFKPNPCSCGEIVDGQERDDGEDPFQCVVCEGKFHAKCVEKWPNTTDHWREC